MNAEIRIEYYLQTIFAQQIIRGLLTYGTISGKPGDDAKRYQIRDVKQAIKLISDEEA